ncbi:MAG: hypothetical protein ACYCW6_11240 [Candidatus Xenobia bacterium]
MLTCPGCRRHGEGEKCSTCDRWLVVRDPDPPEIPSAELGHGMAALWQTSVSVGHGHQAPGALVGALSMVALDLQEMRGEVPPAGGELIDRCMAALSRIHNFVESRDVADLNAGWLVLIEWGRRLKQLEQVGYLDPEPAAPPQHAPQPHEAALATAFWSQSDTVTLDLDD